MTLQNTKPLLTPQNSYKILNTVKEAPFQKSPNSQLFKRLYNPLLILPQKKLCPKSM